MTNLEDSSLRDGLASWKDAAAACFAAAKRRLADARRRGAFRREIAGLERCGMLDAILDDLGVAPWELGRIVTGYPEAQRLLPTMAYRRDVALERLDAATIHELRHTCALCEAHRECRRWLSRGAGDDAPPFCANAALFSELRDATPDAKGEQRP